MVDGIFGRPTKRSRWKVLLVLLVCVPFLASCTKEKAEALKVAAHQLRDEVSQSLIKVRQLYKLELETYLPADDVYESLKKDATKGSFNDAKLTELLAGSKIDLRRNRIIEYGIDSIGEQFALFSGMFDNLPVGYLFATESVNRALKHSANLTIRLANLTNNLHNHPTLGRNNRKRASLVDQIQKAYAVKDPSIRDGLLKGLASQIQQLDQEERENKQAMFESLSRATLAAQTVTELIRDYERLDAGDILAMIKEGLSLGIAISGGSTTVADTLARVKSVEAKLRNDPLIAPLLDVQLNK